MKWKDKDGTEFEGTIEEYSLWKERKQTVSWTDGDVVLTGSEEEHKGFLLRKQESKKEENVKKQSEFRFITLKPKTEIIHSRSHKMWRRFEDRIVKKNYPIVTKVSEWNTLLPGRTYMSIKLRAFNLGVSKFHGKKGKRKPYIKNPNNKNIARFKFMNETSRRYMEAYKWDRQKAMVQASADWNNRGKLGTITPASKEEVKKEVYVLVRWSPETSKTETVDTFVNYEEAKARMQECKDADISINESYQYAITKR